jgi:hypothetical protein
MATNLTIYVKWATWRWTKVNDLNVIGMKFISQYNGYKSQKEFEWSFPDISFGADNAQCIEFLADSQSTELNDCIV